MALQWDSTKVFSLTGDTAFEWYHESGVPRPGYKGRGKNAALIISLGFINAGAGDAFIDSVLVDGVAATNVLLGTHANAWLGYYLLPQSGYFTPLIQAIISGARTTSDGCFGSSYLCYGVDQTTPIINAAISTGTSTTPSASLVATDDRNISYFKLVSNNFTGNSLTANTLPGRYLKELYPYNQPGDSGQLTVFGNHAMSGSGSGGTRTASWTLSGAARAWTIHRCEIKAAGGIHLGV